MRYTRTERLTDTETKALIQKWRTDSDAKARDRIITGHVPLVEFLVKKHYGWVDNDDGEMVQEGMIGLARAVDLFKFGHKVQFSSYSAQWILHRVSRWVAFNQGHSSKYRLVYSRREELKERLASGEPPSSVGKSVRMKAGTLLRALQACEPMARLDAVKDGYGRPLLDTIQANDTADEPFFDKEQRATMRRLVNQLPMRMRSVIKYRLRGWEQKSIAKRLKCTHQTVSLIENRAIGALRAMVEREERKAS